MALREVHKDTFVDSLNDNIVFKYDGTIYSLTIVRAYSDIPNSPPIVSVSFLPTGKKTGLSLAHYISERENDNYNNYGYWDVETVVVRVFARQTNDIDGRNLADTWIRQIENYIKVNWYNIINGATIVRGSFTTPRLLVVEGEADWIYGFEMMFEIVSPNHWTDEPDEGAVSSTDISEIIVDEPEYIRVEK